MKMRTLLSCFAVFIALSTALKAQSVKVPGNDKYSFIYVPGIYDAVDHFFLVPEGDKKSKKIKITLPEASSRYVVSGKPEFITPSVVIVPVANRTDLLVGKYWNTYNLFVPQESGGFFISNPKSYMGYIFSHIRHNSCFIYSEGLSFDAWGNKSDVNIKTIRPNYTLATEDKHYVVYDKTCRKLPFQIPKKAYLLEFYSEYLGYYHGESYHLIDIAAARETSFASVPSYLLDVWNSRFSEFENFLMQSGAAPVRVADGTWFFINDKAESILGPIEAEMVFPFVFYSNQFAPIYRNQKWGIIDRKGKLVHPCTFDSLLVGTNAQNTELRRNDTLFRVDKNGALIAKPIPPKKPEASNQTELTKKPETKYEFVCLVYEFRNPENGKEAYILVNLSFNPQNFDNEKMSSWVLNAIDSDIRGSCCTTFPKTKISILR